MAYFWRDGFQRGWETAMTILKLDKIISEEEYEKYKNMYFCYKKEPTLFNVACPYCGGVDSHSPECRA